MTEILSLSPNSGDLKFPEEGAYDFLSKNGSGYCFPTGDILYVPILTAMIPGKGFGTKLVLSTPKLKEIAIPNIMNPILLRIVLKRGYIFREEFQPDFGEMVEIYYKTEKQMRNNVVKEEVDDV